jgi:hypothetical protein
MCNHNQYAAKGIHSDGNVALNIFSIIINGYSVGILENRKGIGKRYSVLCPILSSFRFISFKHGNYLYVHLFVRAKLFFANVAITGKLAVGQFSG